MFGMSCLKKLGKALSLVGLVDLILGFGIDVNKVEIQCKDVDLICK
jgi:hypothetical protein